MEHCLTADASMHQSGAAAALAVMIPAAAGCGGQLRRNSACFGRAAAMRGWSFGLKQVLWTWGSSGCVDANRMRTTQVVPYLASLERVATHRAGMATSWRAHIVLLSLTYRGTASLCL